ncbi:MAG TPA: hypothetical protein VNU21_01685 [Usitatibacter sp.]|nr:hypothetical protein [Usitatibacter sp.]
MRTTTVSAVLATAGIIVSGCGTLVTTTSFNPHCTAGPTCKVTLGVMAAGSTCQLSNPGTIKVDIGNSPVITWELVDRTGVGYQFPRNGIEFVVKPNFATPPEGVFQVLGPGPANVFRVKDNYRDRKDEGTFNYKVTVVKPDGSPGCELDPPIYNGP